MVPGFRKLGLRACVGHLRLPEPPKNSPLPPLGCQTIDSRMWVDDGLVGEENKAYVFGYGDFSLGFPLHQRCRRFVSIRARTQRATPSPKLYRCSKP